MRAKINNLFISPKSTIRNAMETITQGAHLKLPVGITLVTDEEGKLIGTVTDGDIRRAMVKGFNLNDGVDKIMAKNPITVDKGLSADDMIQMVTRKVKESGRIRDHKVDNVIVTDEENRVVDVVSFYELWYKREVKYRTICIIGTGYVGLTLSISLAEAGYEVIGFDANSEMIRQLNNGQVDIYEKGLTPLLKLHLRDNNLRFTNTVDGEKIDVYILCVGTPLDSKTNNPNLDNIKKAAETAGSYLKKDDVVILRSTVPVGVTRNVVLPILEESSSLKGGTDFCLVFAPERSVEGRALEENKNIPQIIGGINRKSAREAGRIFQLLNSSIVLLDNLEEAEMVKLINNSFRDLSFAFANNIALLCDKLGLNANKIIKAANDGYPRNPIACPSPGVGGYCLTKDPYLLAYVAEKVGGNAEIYYESRRINCQMPIYVSKKIRIFVETKLSKEPKVKIYLLGFAFKGYPETSDMRGSTTIDVLNAIRRDLGKKVEIFGYDPFVRRKYIEELGVKYCTYKDGFKNANCVLLMNNNPEFATLDIYTLLETMKIPAMLFDSWSFFEPHEISRIEGVVYESLGEKPI